MKKKLLYFSMLLAVAMFGVSCDKDDDKTGTSADLVGTWVQTHHEFWEKSDGTIQKEGNDDNTIENAKGTITFNSGGKGVELFKDTPSKVYEYEFAWTYNSSKGELKIIYDGEEDDPEISKVTILDSSTLVLESTETWTKDGKTYESYSKSIFTKISE